MAKGFDERKPTALSYSDNTSKSGNYRPMSYEEAIALRQKVREEALKRESEAASEY